MKRGSCQNFIIRNCWAFHYAFFKNNFNNPCKLLSATWAHAKSVAQWGKFLKTTNSNKTKIKRSPWRASKVRQAGNIEKKGGKFSYLLSNLVLCGQARDSRLLSLIKLFSLNFPFPLLSVVVNEKGKMKINELKIIAMTLRDTC